MLSKQQLDRNQRLALRLAGIELVERHREQSDHRHRRPKSINQFTSIVGGVDWQGLSKATGRHRQPALHRNYIL